MTIPLDDLYHYIKGLVSKPVCMYLFYPHGSRNILNLIGLSNDKNFSDKRNQSLLVVCHDQEPLNYHLYDDHSSDVVDLHYEYCQGLIDRHTIKKSNISLPTHVWFNKYKKIILLHSEKNSDDLKMYESQGYEPVHYWSHAVIARDWYRFAEFDQRLDSAAVPEKDFLIYSRDWSGSREYRIKFQQLLFDHQLVNDSVTSIRKLSDCNISILQHQFKNANLKPGSFDFLNFLQDNNFGSSASGSYDPDDFNSTKLSVVLETVVDSGKIHLTEKTVRPLACGHPFMLAAGPGSLEYLRSYGFKTFGPWIDESYDLEENTVLRLEKIIYAMKQFNNLNSDKKIQVWREIKKIANYNRTWFFSKSFTDVVHNELKNNLSKAVDNITNSSLI